MLDRAVELHPDHVPVRAGRGVRTARRGKRDEALRDAQRALAARHAPAEPVPGRVHLRADLEDPPGGQARGVPPALVARSGPGSALDIVDTDPDLDPLRKDAEFAALVAGARAAAKRD